MYYGAMTTSLLNPSHLLTARYEGRSYQELQGVQQVHIGDYRKLEAEVEALAQRIKSGADGTRKLKAELSTLVARKVRLLEEINAIGNVIDRLDGTVQA